MKKQCDHKNPLLRDGLSQTQRSIPALDPRQAKIDDRSTKDLLEYAYRYASQLRYFDTNNINRDDQNWQAFWETINGKTLEEIESSSNNEPHLALFLSFLKLFSFAQDQMNTLSGRHLDFYYKEILQLQQKTAEADKVHLIFELAKNANQQMITAGTALKAGKDKTGIPMQYTVEEDTIISKAQVELLRSVYRKNDQLFFASVSNSIDGLGEEPVEEGQTWKAFGSSSLPIASLGFALASPILVLQEGIRNVTLNLNISSLVDLDFSNTELQGALEVYVSGEKEWLGPFELSEKSSCRVITDDFNSHLLKINFEIPKDIDGVVPYNEEVLAGGFNTSEPVVRVVFNNNPNSKVFTQLEKTALLKLHIVVDVKDVQALTLENDLGLLNASKPFMPFGPQPLKGSGFYIGSKEAFTKNLRSFKIKSKWQNLPEGGFKTHYANYKEIKNSANKKVLAPGFIVNNNFDFKAKVEVLTGKNWGHDETITLFNNKPSDALKAILIDFNIKASGHSSVQELKRLSKESKLAKPRYRQSHLRAARYGMLVAKFEDRISFKKNTNKKTRKPISKKAIRQSKSLNTQQKNGFIKLSLTKDFGHKAYPLLFAMAMTKNANKSASDDLSLPNEPYTPLIESISLDYIAETDMVLMDNNTNENKTRFENREIQYFHLAPFGHSEEHSYLKTELPFRHSTFVRTIPEYFEEGTFYIGMKGVQPRQSLNILFQLDEGTANPESPRQDVEWSILSNNHWKVLDSNDILSDQTNQLLTSGILKMIIPKEATDDNTLLDDGYYWLKASVNKHTDAVCSFVGVHTQAIKAVFNPQNNDPHHLEAALEAGTISKLQNRVASIKKVNQPYASFDGYMEEDSTVFYTRVSERIRHKNRAVAIWDYEHLLLERFPDLYKVKCLNHTSRTSEMAPGYVSIIAIPKLRNKNTPNQLKPRVSSNTIVEIEDYLSDLSAVFTTIIAQNPDYEEVRLSFEIAFHDGLEFGFYKKQLNEDIKKFLTPWAFEEGKDIAFGGRIHKSILLSFIDSLSYVDFVSNFEMFHIICQYSSSGEKTGTTETKKDIITASNSRAILVSAENHIINSINEALYCK